MARVQVPCTFPEGEALTAAAFLGRGGQRFRGARSAFMVRAALAGLVEPARYSRRGRPRWDLQVPVIVSAPDLERIRAKAAGAALPLAAYLRACGLAEARRLGVPLHARRGGGRAVRSA